MTSVPAISHPSSTDEVDPEQEQDDSRPPGAGGKEGSGHSDGRDGPYEEEPE